MNNPRSLLRLAVLPAAIAALVTGCAPYDPYWNPTGSTMEPSLSTFDRLDTNRDGFLSRGELDVLGLRPTAPVSSETATVAFQRMDANADGFLSRGEAQTLFGAIPGGSFDVADMNRDGFLSLPEAMPHLRWYESRNVSAGVPTFDTYDADRDGFLTRGEAAPLLHSWHWSNGRWVFAAPTPGTVPPAPVSAYEFDRHDLNRDGFLSRAEASAMAGPATFDRFDGDRDGFLSRTETDVMLRSGIGVTTGTYGGAVYGPRY
ncbi:MAG TPA: hypothetical protein VED01_03940 [Burkholderiales bacterium]|nr:hypothetical protein [Burkholderiales bacterium]